MKHYYHEQAELADKLIDLGFEYRNTDFYFLRPYSKSKILIAIRSEKIYIFPLGTSDNSTSEDNKVYYYSDYSIKEIIEKIKEYLPKPHWEVDGVDLNLNQGLWRVDLEGKHLFYEHFDNWAAFRPWQYVGEESDFTILYKDGSVKYAKWIK